MRQVLTLPSAKLPSHTGVWHGRLTATVTSGFNEHDIPVDTVPVLPATGASNQSVAGMYRYIPHVWYLPCQVPVSQTFFGTKNRGEMSPPTLAQIPVTHPRNNNFGTGKLSTGNYHTLRYRYR